MAHLNKKGTIVGQVPGEDQEGPFPLAPGEYFETCPYDSSHRITNNRLLCHLAKCRRNYIKEMTKKGQEVNMVACKFNFTHQMLMAEIRFHEERCEDQWSVIQHIDYMSSEKHQKTKQALRERVSVQKKQQEQIKAKEKAKFHSKSFSDSKNNNGDKESNDKEMDMEQFEDSDDDDDWEKSLDANEVGYNPRLRLENNPVIFMDKGLTHSEKIAFRIQHRKLFAQKRLGNQDQMLQSGVTETVFVTSPSMSMNFTPMNQESNGTSMMNASAPFSLGLSKSVDRDDGDHAGSMSISTVPLSAPASAEVSKECETSSIATTTRTVESEDYFTAAETDAETYRDLSNSASEDMSKLKLKAPKKKTKAKVSKVDLEF